MGDSSILAMVNSVVSVNQYNIIMYSYQYIGPGVIRVNLQSVYPVELTLVEIRDKSKPLELIQRWNRSALREPTRPV